MDHWQEKRIEEWRARVKQAYLDAPKEQRARIKAIARERFREVFGYLPDSMRAKRPLMRSMTALVAGEYLGLPFENVKEG